MSDVSLLCASKIGMYLYLIHEFSVEFMYEKRNQNPELLCPDEDVVAPIRNNTCRAKGQLCYWQKPSKHFKYHVFCILYGSKIGLLK